MLEKKKVIVKQVANKYGKYNMRSIRTGDGKDVSKEVGEFTMAPTATRSLCLKRKPGGGFHTGLENISPDVLAHLEASVGQSLSETSSYWENFFIKIDFKGLNSMELKLESIKDYLVYKAGIAGGIIAPSLQELRENPLYRDTIFYIHDEEAVAQEKVKLQELKDGITALLFQFRHNLEKLRLLSYMNGTFFNKFHDAGVLYTMLSEKKEELKTRKSLEDFYNFLSTDDIYLQANYYVDKGLNTGIITSDLVKNSYRLLGKEIHGSLKDVKKTLTLPENQELLAHLIIEVQNREV